MSPYIEVLFGLALGVYIVTTCVRFYWWYVS